MTAAQRERRALVETMRTVGPDAPTLCGDWTTRDLAAHLVDLCRVDRQQPGVGTQPRCLAHTHTKHDPARSGTFAAGHDLLPGAQNERNLVRDVVITAGQLGGEVGHEDTGHHVPSPCTTSEKPMTRLR